VLLVRPPATIPAKEGRSQEMMQVKPGENGVYKDQGPVKVLVVSENGDIVVEHPNGDLTVCKANELRTAEDEAA
jgi:hypothetical protein